MLPTIQNDGYYLTREEMVAIRNREYHYNAWSSTILDPYMQPFWRWVVTFVPTWVAPSTLSICGLICNIVATCTTAYLAPTLTEPLPSWVCITNAISIFAYQTFDGIDGKQSSRTQNSEVEEYVDHAVDSISITFNAVLLAATLQLGDSPVLLGLNLVMALSAFFAAHWAAHSSNSLIFGHVDVTEAQWSMVAIHLLSAARSSAIWKSIIFEAPLTRLKDIVCLTTAATMLFATVVNVVVALGLQETPLEANGVKIPRSPLSLWPILTYSIILTGALLCFCDGLLASQSVPTLLIVGLAMGKASTAMIMQKLFKKCGPTIGATSCSPLVLFVVGKFLGVDSNLVRVAAWTLVAMLATDICVSHERATSDMALARGISRFILKEEPGQEKSEDKGFYVCGGNFSAIQKAWEEFAKDVARVKATYPEMSIK